MRLTFCKASNKYIKCNFYETMTSKTAKDKKTICRTKAKSLLSKLQKWLVRKKMHTVGNLVNKLSVRRVFNAHLFTFIYDLFFQISITILQKSKWTMTSHQVESVKINSMKKINQMWDWASLIQAKLNSTYRRRGTLWSISPEAKQQKRQL